MDLNETLLHGKPKRLSPQDKVRLSPYRGVSRNAKSLWQLMCQIKHK